MDDVLPGTTVSVHMENKVRRVGVDHGYQYPIHYYPITELYHNTQSPIPNNEIVEYRINQIISNNSLAHPHQTGTAHIEYVEST